MQQELDGILKEIKTIKSTTNYWLVRSMGGNYFDEYTTRGYIAIGYNEVNLDEVKLAISFGKKANEQLKLIIESKGNNDSNLDDEQKAQYAAPQLLKFCNEIQIGDIIVIPGKNSDFVAVARIESDVYEEKNVSILEGVCNFSKRRRIKILRILYRSKLNPKMLLMFSSHHIISNVNQYSEYIDNCISDFYIKEDTTYLVLRVKEEEALKASDFGVASDLIDLLNEFAEEQHIKINSDEIKAKICVQSPGDILLFATSWEGITIIGLFIFFLTGGKIALNKTDGLNMEGGNIFKAISEFLDRRRERKLIKVLEDKMRNMDMDTPDDFVKILEEFNKRKS